MTKHRILIEFESAKPLPADFTDQIAGRVYTIDLVDKVECTATLLTKEDFDNLGWTEQCQTL